ncbi:flagellar biosynthesis anti-sigma factor FlgM [Frateuria defendens]|uniref:flagellar biosynthesis anti-sigma factor FlgM n=1 Tax=Frateuria defendens TaxID=2219559 RepID=UPI00066FFC3E|nr:flagellar biosynthesis anti-sigma factor FlgM [Frateuria defendens]
MNTTISHNGLPLLPQTTSGQGGSGPAQGAGTGGATAGTATGGDDRVRLTDSARALQEASRPGEGAAIDSQRVEKIRAALADGSYQVNPGRIADGMLSLDRQIGGTAPTGKA